MTRLAMRIERDRLIQARARQFAIKAGWIPVRGSRSNFVTITEKVRD